MKGSIVAVDFVEAAENLEDREAHGKQRDERKNRRVRKTGSDERKLRAFDLMAGFVAGLLSTERALSSAHQGPDFSRGW